MKITSSSVAMASAHQESSFTYKESVTMEAAKSKDAANRSVEAATGAQLPVWMQFDKTNLKAEILAVPTREQIAPTVDEQAIVELYSR